MSGPDPHRQDEWFRKAFALLLVTLFTVLFARLIAPFIEALLLAIVLSGLLYPMYAWIERRAASPLLAAGVVTSVVLLAIVLPLMFVVAAFTQQAIQLSGEVVPWIEQQAASARIAFVWPDWLPFSDRVDVGQALSRLGETLGSTGAFFVGGLGSVTQTTFMFVLQLVIMLYTIFYLVLAGPRLMNVFDYTPLTETDRRLVAERGLSITRATLKGTVVIGVLQGALAGIAFAVVGVPGPVFWGVIMTILSAVPGIGAALVWIPAVVVLLFRGELAAGIGLALWCTLVVSTVDNLVRPYLVGHDTQMPAVLILLSTLGGIAMFGAAGIIIGPLLAGFFLTSWHIFGVAFRRELADSETGPALSSGIVTESSSGIVTDSSSDTASEPGPAAPAAETPQAQALAGQERGGRIVTR